MEKKVKIILCLIGAYFIVSIICGFIYESEKIIYIGDYTKVTLDGDNIVVKNENYKVDNVGVKTYFNKKFVNSYLFSTEVDNNYSYFVVDENKNALQTGDILAVSGNIDINVYDYLDEIMKETDLNKIKETLNKENPSWKYTYGEKYRYKNNENQIMFLYTVYATTEEDDFVIFMVEDDTDIRVFDYEKITRDENEDRMVSFYNLIDFNSDGYYEIVLKERNGDDLPIYYHIYEFDGADYKEIKGE